MRYLIEVTGPLPADLVAAAKQVAAAFGAPAARVLELLERAPGIVTKPIDEREAGRVMVAFTAVGISARVLPHDPDAATVLDRVLDAAGSEPLQVVHRRGVTETAGEGPSSPAAEDPLDRDAAAEPDPGIGLEGLSDHLTDSAPDSSPDSPLGSPPDSLPEGLIDSSPDTPPPRPAGTPPVADPNGAPGASAAPPVRSGPVITPRFDLPNIEMGDLDVADLDLTDPGLSERSRQMYAALDATLAKMEAEGTFSVAAPASAAAPNAAAAPPPPSAAADGEAPFDPQAFTQALLDEHGLDESLLDGLESEAKAFDLGDRAARLTVEELPASGKQARLQRSPFLSRVDEPSDDERSVVAVSIDQQGHTPPGFSLDVETPQPSAAVGGARGRGIRFKVLLAGLMPALLTAIFALAAVAVTVRPALRAQQSEGAAASAAAFAATLPTRLLDAAIDGPAAAAELQRAAVAARAAMLQSGSDFLLVTDARGSPLAGWSLESVEPAAVAREKAPLLAPALAAIFGTSVAVPGGSAVAPTPDPARVAVAPLQVEGRVIGAVLVGRDPASSAGRTRTIMLIVLAAVLIPLLIAVVVSAALTGSLLHNLEVLTRAADRISRGKLARPVELDTDDELSELARAIERMRISLQEGMERLRRRRQ